ncbi:MAG: hypothetical protein V1673_04530 [Candidatus Omnitrophota bacterium]
MKEKMVFGLAALFLVALTGTPALYAESDVTEVFSQDDDGGSDPSAFEGDTDSMPGERAPENLPMDDSPVDAGMGIR